MTKTHEIKHRALLLAAAVIVLLAASRLIQADTGICGGQMITLPFADVPSSNIFFCAIAEAYFTGLTNGTSATTYSPSANVTREQMAAFITRSVDQSLRRGSPRAALGQFWRTANSAVAVTNISFSPAAVKSDGEDLWIAHSLSTGHVSRVHASDGRLIDTWTGAGGASDVIIARGRVYLTGSANNGSLYALDPRLAPGTVTTLASNFGSTPSAMAFDGANIWIADTSGTVIRVRFDGAVCVPVCVTSFATGFGNPVGILYDGSYIWVTDNAFLKRVNSDGTVGLSVAVDAGCSHPVFDGINIWVPNRFSDSITVVRVKDAAGNPLASPFVLATLTENRLDQPYAAAFDGERILVTNLGGDSASLWRATDFAPLGSVFFGTDSLPKGICSDGKNFWIVLNQPDKLARF